VDLLLSRAIRSIELILLISGTFPQTYLRRDSQFIVGVVMYTAAAGGS